MTCRPKEWRQKAREVREAQGEPVKEQEEPVEGQAQYATHTDNDVVVRLDIQVHAELQNEWLTRELINRIQKMRKRAGLQATDDVFVFHRFEKGEGEDILRAMEEHGEVIQRTVRATPRDVGGMGEHLAVLIEEEQEIAETRFVLTLAQNRN